MSQGAASRRIRKLDVVEAATTPQPLLPSDIIAGTPRATVRILSKSANGSRLCGVWHCTPGSFYLTHEEETATLIVGRATVTPDGGEPVAIGAGDVVYFEAGMKVRWDVEDTVRKSFHIHDPSVGQRGSP